jgi:hypothetical protein
MISQQLASAFSQLLVVCLLAGIVYSIHRFIHRSSLDPHASSTQNLRAQSFFQYIGIQSSKNQLDVKFLWILLALIAFGILSTFLQFHYSEGFKRLLLSDNSPYGKILKGGFNSTAIISWNYS